MRFNNDLSISGSVSQGDAFTMLWDGSSLASTIDFTLPTSTANNLLLSCHFRSNATTATARAVRVRFNGDSGSNYTYSEFSLTDTGGSPATTYGEAQAQGIVSRSPGSASDANYYTATRIWIPQYRNTTFYKTWSSQYFNPRDSTAAAASISYLGFWAGTWASTSAITSLSFFFLSATEDFVAGSTIAIRGW